MSISAGNFHCGAVDEAGRAFCWGWNEYGSVGVKDAPGGGGGDLVKSPVECLTSSAAAAVNGGGGGAGIVSYGGGGGEVPRRGVRALSCGGAHTVGRVRL